MESEGKTFLLLQDSFMKRLDSVVMSKCQPFSCGNTDLDDFFSHDALLYADELLGKTYYWITYSVPHKVVAAVTLSNDSIKTRSLQSKEKNKLQRKISNPKRGRSYPAVLIGRLGVDSEFQGSGNHVGSQLMDFLKEWFRHEDNKTGCRFIVVDAYNNEQTIHYYATNGFSFLHATEEDEKSFYEISEDEPLKTRLMYFDLKSLGK